MDNINPLILAFYRQSLFSFECPPEINIVLYFCFVALCRLHHFTVFDSFCIYSAFLYDAYSFLNRWMCLCLSCKCETYRTLSSGEVVFLDLLEFRLFTCIQRVGLCSTQTALAFCLSYRADFLREKQCSNEQQKLILTTANSLTLSENG